MLLDSKFNAIYYIDKLSWTWRVGDVPYFPFKVRNIENKELKFF